MTAEMMVLKPPGGSRGTTCAHTSTGSLYSIPGWFSGASGSSSRTSSSVPVYTQIIDKQHNLIMNNMVTPIRLVLNLSDIAHPRPVHRRGQGTCRGCGRQFPWHIPQGSQALDRSRQA